MVRASVAHQDGTLRDVVAGPAVAGTSVHGVLVVEAPAGRVEFDQLVAHGDCEQLGGGAVDDIIYISYRSGGKESGGLAGDAILLFEICSPRFLVLLRVDVVTRKRADEGW